MISLSRRKLLSSLGVSGLALAQGSSWRARAADKTVKIGIIGDESGVFADAAGPGCVTAAHMAAADLGNVAGGMPIEILVADGKNDPDLCSSLVREWMDKGVDVVVDGTTSNAALAIQHLLRDKGKIHMVAGPGTSLLTEQECAPFGFHFIRDSYTVAKSTGLALTKGGGDTWFFITVDYALGDSLQNDTTEFVKAAGGKVLGSVRHPPNSPDMSSYLLQAQASKAKIIGLANAGSDTQNAIKQAAEFGITQGGQRLAALNLYVTDVMALGLPVAKGLYVTSPFYWDLTDATRDFTKRFRKEISHVPTYVQAGSYTAVYHYLKGVNGAGSTDSAAVSKWMHENPVNDFYNEGVGILRNGLVLHKIHLFQVKTPAESQDKSDVYKLISTVSGPDAHRKESESACPFLKG